MTCEVFDYARDELDLTLSVVDIGGGFVDGEQEEAEIAYKQTATVINESTAKVFAAYPDVRLIAEPGRFFAQATTCSFAQVIGKRQVAAEDGQVRIHSHLCHCECQTLCECYLGVAGHGQALHCTNYLSYQSCKRSC